jgi:hypothetical protein
MFPDNTSIPSQYATLFSVGICGIFRQKNSTFGEDLLFLLLPINGKYLMLITLKAFRLLQIPGQFADTDDGATGDLPQPRLVRGVDPFYD